MYTEMITVGGEKKKEELTPGTPISSKKEKPVLDRTKKAIE